MSRYSLVFDIFRWAVVFFNAGVALHLWFNLRNKPQAMFCCGVALYLTDLFPLMVSGLVLVPGFFLMLRQQGANSR
jgi:hypothetical protein